MKNKFIALIVFIIPFLVIATPLQVQLSGNYMYSNIDGFIQIPLDGQVNTTTINKPNFSDIGMTYDKLWNTQIDITKNAWGSFLNYQNQTQKSSSILTYNLLTHGINFPADTAITANLKFNIWTGGVYYNFTTCQWVFQPILAISILNFYYGLASSITFTKRDFVQFTPRIGLNIIYHITPKFNLSLTELTSIPKLVNTEIYSTAAKADYTIYQNSAYSVDVFGGLAYQKINFKDYQTISNNIQLKNWPMAFMGLSIKF